MPIVILLNLIISAIEETCIPFVLNKQFSQLLDISSIKVMP